MVGQRIKGLRAPHHSEKANGDNKMMIALICFIISLFILGMVLGDYLREREEKAKRR